MVFLNIIAQERSYGGLGLTLTFLWEVQVCFWGFYTGRVHGTRRTFGAEVNKCSLIMRT